MHKGAGLDFSGLRTQSRVEGLRKLGDAQPADKKSTTSYKVARFRVYGAGAYRNLCTLKEGF